jgi:uncharacterized protein YndB with AHSA1/START domain
MLRAKLMLRSREKNMGTPETNPTSLPLTRTFEVPKRRLFSLWKFPDWLHWLGIGASSASLPPTTAVGRRFEIDLPGHMGIPDKIEGQYLTVDEPNSLSFTWKRTEVSGRRMPTTAGAETEVRVTLTEKQGETNPNLEDTKPVSPTTELSLAIPDTERSFWDSALDRLADHLAPK